ncbi:putative host specificity protein, partial [Escherichia coli PA23]
WRLLASRVMMHPAIWIFSKER